MYRFTAPSDSILCSLNALAIMRSLRLGLDCRLEVRFRGSFLRLPLFLLARTLDQARLAAKMLVARQSSSEACMFLSPCSWKPKSRIWEYAQMPYLVGRIALLIFISSISVASAQDNPSPLPSGLRSARIFGTVTYSDGRRPARNATIVAVPSPSKQIGNSSSNASKDIRGYSDLNGNYSLEVDGDMEYHVVAGLPGYLSWNDDTQDPNKLHIGVTIQVQATGSSRVDLSLSKGAAIEGNVSYDDGSPATGLVVDLIPVDPISTPFSRGVDPPRETLTDDTGRYRLFGLPFGHYKVMTAVSNRSVEGENQEPLKVYAGSALSERTADTVKLDEGQQQSGVDIVIPLSTLYTVSGTVNAPDGRNATSGFVALETPVDPSDIRHAAVSPSGMFSFSYVPVGQHCLKASHAMYSRSSATNTKLSVDSIKPYCFQLNGDITALSIVTAPPAN